jgi:hypothetical protein
VAHFLYKREEVKALVESWVKEAEELAVYEAYLCRRAELAKAAIKSQYESERAASEAAWRVSSAAGAAKAAGEAAAATAAAAAASAAAAAMVGTAKVKKAAAKAAAAMQQAAALAVAHSRPPPFLFTPSHALRTAMDRVSHFLTAYSKWCADTAVVSHQVFGGRVGGAGGAVGAGLQARVNAALEASDALKSVRGACGGGGGGAAAAAAASAMVAGVEKEAGIPWSPVAGGRGFGGGGVGGGGGGYYGGGGMYASGLGAFAVDLDQLKTAHSCTAFNLAGATAEAADTLIALLNGLTQEGLDATED